MQGKKLCQVQNLIICFELLLNNLKFKNDIENRKKI